MICANTFQGKRVAVFGLGRSGLATCRALTAGGAHVSAWDDGETARKAASEAGFVLVDLKFAEWASFAALILAPGVPLTHPEPHWTVKMARDWGVEIIGDIEVFARERDKLCPESPFVAITGTNGKSTITALITHILQSAGRDAQMGGNIGVPILDLDPPTVQRIHVIELSSYQIDLMPTLKPSIGILTNISPDHLDRHGGFDNYTAIKARVPVSAELAVIGIDDAASRMIFATEKSRRTTTIPISGGSLKHGIGMENHTIIHRTAPSLPFFSSKYKLVANLEGIVSLRGRHNGQNASAATAACLSLGLTYDQIGTGLKTFAGLPHRLEEVGRIGHVIFINDSKATNAESTAHALTAFDSNIYWIAGGLPKAGGIAPLSAYFSRIKKAYLIGEAARDFAQTLEGHCPLQKSGTLQSAVAEATLDAQSTAGSGQAVVLLSPACASFDQFRSFEARGDTFRALVGQLPNIVMRKGNL